MRHPSVTAISLVMSLLIVSGCWAETSTIVTVGTPAPERPIVLPVPPICIGIPIVQCRDTASTAMEGGPMATGRRLDDIVRITVRCLKICTPQMGDGETRIDYADGTSEVTGWGYASDGG